MIKYIYHYSSRKNIQVKNIPIYQSPILFVIDYLQDPCRYSKILKIYYK